MSNGAMASDYIKRLEHHVSKAREALDEGKGIGCPVGSPFPEIVMCLGGLELEKLKDKNSYTQSGFSVESKWGKVQAGGTAALVLILIAAVVILALERMRVLNMPVLGKAAPRAAEMAVVGTHNER